MFQVIVRFSAVCRIVVLIVLICLLSFYCYGLCKRTCMLRNRLAGSARQEILATYCTKR